MKFLLQAVICCTAFTCCTSEYKLAVFTCNNHRRNGCIVNRRPDYGDGRTDGCLVLRELRLDIKKLAANSIEGNLTDVDSHAPLSSSSIKIFYNNRELPLELITDKQGQFNSNNAAGIKRITAFAISYRMLLVDLTDRNLLKR